MKFKNVNIFEADGRRVYSDQYGIIKCNIGFSLFDEKTEKYYDSQYVFVKHGEKYERVSPKYKPSKCAEIFGAQLCVLSQKYYDKRRRYGYYNANGNDFPQSADDIELIECSKIKIEFGSNAVEVVGSDPQIPDINVWMAKDDNWELQRVKYHQLKPGELVNYGVACTCEVQRILDPDPQNNLCVIKSLRNGELYTVASGNRDLYWVPYIEHKSELAIFNEMINERALSPFVLEEGNKTPTTKTRNVFWQPVDDASQYIVSVYKYYRDHYNDCNNRLYHMADHTVDRNVCFLTVKDLLGEDFIFTVAAENRNGEIIAKSRGILDEGKPQFWEEK